jgi:hypothetical protein
MSEIVYRISGVLSSVVKGVPVGTNLGLAYLMWMLMSGHMLKSRGAVIPGLAAMGMPAVEVRRTWAAMRYGVWETAELVENWRAVVADEGKWQARVHEGWRAVPVDLTAFYRPRLAGLETKHYDSIAGKALPAIPYGIAVQVGQLGDVRLGLPLAFERMEAGETSESLLEARLLAKVQAKLAADEVVVLDAGFSLSRLREAGVERFVLRVATNFTARRATRPDYKGSGARPKYGDVVRPLPRKHKDKVIAATPPDRQETFIEDGRIIQAAYWDKLVGRQEKAGSAQTFNCAVFHDPRYRQPLVISYSVPVSGPALRQLFRDRWPVEVLPLTAKPILGAGRQFVFAPESCQRLPELALLAGSILTYVAATHDEPIPTGFWDRQPQPTSGRLRRALATLSFSMLTGFAEELHKKDSRTDHLPKGVNAHRRQKRPILPADSDDLAA